jgi:hypothetical protein
MALLVVMLGRFARRGAKPGSGLDILAMLGAPPPRWS